MGCTVEPGSFPLARQRQLAIHRLPFLLCLSLSLGRIPKAAPASSSAPLFIQSIHSNNHHHDPTLTPPNVQHLPRINRHNHHQFYKLYQGHQLPSTTFNPNPEHTRRASVRVSDPIRPPPCPASTSQTTTAMRRCTPGGCRCPRRRAQEQQLSAAYLTEVLWYVSALLFPHFSSWMEGHPAHNPPL